MEIDLRKVIEAKSPGFFRVLPGFLSTVVLKFLERVNNLDELRAFFDQYSDAESWEFIDAVFEHLNFNCHVSDQEIAKIPSTGRLICVANHRLGPLDGLALLKIIGSVRKDVKIVVNDILLPLENMRERFLFYDLYSTTLQKTNIQKIHAAISDENAVIFFPAGTVAKLTMQGVREAPWQNGPVMLSQKYKTPILPMYVNARSSLLYYLVSLLNKDLPSLFLSQAMFRQRSRTMRVRIGDLISHDLLAQKGKDTAVRTEFLRNQVLKLGNKQH